MTLEEIITQRNIIMAALLESKARAKEIEAKLNPLQQALYKEQEIQANLRLEYSLWEHRRFEMEKPSPEAEKLVTRLMKQHALSREFALEVVAELRPANRKGGRHV